MTNHKLRCIKNDSSYAHHFERKTEARRPISPVRPSVHPLVRPRTQTKHGGQADPLVRAAMFHTQVIISLITFTRSLVHR